MKRRRGRRRSPVALLLCAHTYYQFKLRNGGYRKHHAVKFQRRIYFLREILVLLLFFLDLDSLGVKFFSRCIVPKCLFHQSSVLNDNAPPKRKARRKTSALIEKNSTAVNRSQQCRQNLRNMSSSSVKT